MRRIVFALVAVGAAAGVVASMALASGQRDGEAAPIFGVTIPPGYRDWRVISVAYEEGDLNDLRAILGNDVALKAYREGKLPFPDGTIIARLAWSYDPLEESEKAFGRRQSFVAGPPKNGVQFMVKDSSKYASTGGWGMVVVPTEDFAQLPLQLADRTPWRDEVIRPVLLFAARTPQQRSGETQTHPANGPQADTPVSTAGPAGAPAGGRRGGGPGQDDPDPRPGPARARSPQGPR